MTTEWSGSPRAALLTALAYALATPAFAYANNLYGHQLTAFLLFAAFYAAYRAARGVAPTRYAAVTGFCLGAALITEYPAALIAAGIGLYAIFRWRSRERTGLMLLAALPPVGLAAAYNWSIFQTPLPVGYLYSSLYAGVHSVGLVSLTYPKIEILLQLAFGVHRGLFLLSPFLLLAVPGFYWFAQVRALRAEFYLALWAVVSFWLFNSSSAMWQGGFGVGPRYLLPMLPFMALPMVFVFARARALWARAGIVVLLVASLLLVWAVTIGGQQFPQYQAFPLVEYSLPRLLQDEIARNFGMLLNLKGIASVIPLGIAVAGLTIVFLRCARPPQPAAHVVSSQTHTASH